ncbi:MAG: UDP-N-acetylglucosamine 1-carboxyvinyltransferase [Oscillospiraceae bacterium]|nr:UDP-N-acetylglucosamine 1-carboxyvinyltransferase [Oscillospiraceae bacterium]MDE6777492.1 UDP-N-acetylglucosamine 1-carboxyvinyltransferase [Oscillospiraceae bacterium]MDE7094180.1 UDP-N-acetylglucosamine 1-carboxyvinyltransferase [Oscillospiraceae bacterium]
MEKFVINGGHPLKGEILVSGAKNSAVAILPATLLLDVPCIIENVPDISDVEICLKILKGLGAEVKPLNQQGDTYWISCRNVSDFYVPYKEAKKMRASYYFLGALLGRCGNARAAMPGGCSLGARPIDQHLKAFEILGAKQLIEDQQSDIVELHAESLRGGNISMDVVSVGATMNAILAAVKAPGITIIENAAKEPHVVDLANFLNYMGANIKGAGTDVIKIEGVKKLAGNAGEGSTVDYRYSVVPDQIEAGTFMVAAAATKGDVIIKGVIPKHLEAITAKLIDCGVNVEELDNMDAIRVSVENKKIFCPTNIKTEPYPGFPTDMQPQMATLLTIANGESSIMENVWEDRFRYVHELRKMGAEINITQNGAVVRGGDLLTGACVNACDLRAGAAMIIAGLMANGCTEITEIQHIERGYADIAKKLRGIGADIVKI